MIVDINDTIAAAACLKKGKLVAFPTETVYGLGADARSDLAVASIYAAKDRPQFNPLIVHVRSLEEAARYAEITPLAEKLAARFWPGALTLVLNRTKECELSLLVSAGMDTVALRMPSHPIALALLDAADMPVAAPSANRSGRISPTDASHVESELGGRGIFILDGGVSSIGVESTVIDARGVVPALLRPGGVTAEMLGEVTYPDTHAGYISPGMLESHYAPDRPLRLNVTEVKNGEALLAFGTPISDALIVQNLSPTKNLEEAAANLFRMLRVLDASGVSSIAVMPIDGNGLGAAINDRLQRAATPK